MSKLDDLRIDAPVAKPRRRSRPPWVPIVLILFIGALLLYFNRGRILEALQQSQVAQPTAGEETAEAPSAAAAQARSGPPGSISAAGYLEVTPPGPDTVSALVSGKLAEVLVIPGEEVHRGQVVARLDSGNLRQRAAVLATRVQLASRQLELKQAGFRSEEIRQAQAALDSAQSRYQLASSTWQRSEKLFEKGVVSRQEFEDDETALSQAQSGVDDALARLELLQAGTRTEEIGIAEAELAAAQAELRQVNWEIGQCAIQAPRDGVVLEQLARSGDWLHPGTDNPYSAAVLSIFDPSQVQAWVDVNQRDSGGLFAGQRVEMTTDAHPQRIVSGTVSRIMPQANLQKNTVQAKISIDDVPPDFRPELSVKVNFLPAESTTESPAEKGAENGN